VRTMITPNAVAMMVAVRKQAEKMHAQDVRVINAHRAGFHGAFTRAEVAAMNTRSR
jgi:hypothetical protein